RPNGAPPDPRLPAGGPGPGPAAGVGAGARLRECALRSHAHGLAAVRLDDAVAGTRRAAGRVRPYAPGHGDGSDQSTTVRLSRSLLGFRIASVGDQSGARTMTHAW